MKPPWWPAFDASIRNEFNFSSEADRVAAEALRPHVGPAHSWQAFAPMLRGRHLVIFGCGPGLLQGASFLPGTHGRDAEPDAVVVACDGATSWLREEGVAPQVVFTDLDGDANDLVWAAQQGAALVVHPHGDNVPALHSLAPRLNAWGSHAMTAEAASKELEPLWNFGGFTDGDRAVMTALAAGARSTLLVGFEYDAPPTAYSHRWDPRTKPAKLAWSRRIVERAQQEGTLRIRHADASLVG